MKKLLTVCIILLFLSAAAMAQRNTGDLRDRRADLTGLERIQLQRDLFRFHIFQRNADRDRFTEYRERKKIYKLKRRIRSGHTRGRLI